MEMLDLFARMLQRLSPGHLRSLVPHHLDPEDGDARDRALDDIWSTLADDYRPPLTFMGRDPRLGDDDASYGFYPGGMLLYFLKGGDVRLAKAGDRLKPRDEPWECWYLVHHPEIGEHVWGLVSADREARRIWTFDFQPSLEEYLELINEDPMLESLYPVTVETLTNKDRVISELDVYSEEKGLVHQPTLVKGEAIADQFITFRSGRRGRICPRCHRFLLQKVRVPGPTKGDSSEEILCTGRRQCRGDQPVTVPRPGSANGGGPA